MIVAATEENVERAAELIRAGELVAFPTETVYGLGARADDPRAVAGIFAAKERPSFDPLIVHVDRIDAVTDLTTDFPAGARKLAERFWPGPLTLVLPKRSTVPDIVTAGLPAVAVRVPNHPVALSLIAQAQTPIAAPSANRFGCVSPTAAEHVEEQLGGRIALVLDAGRCRVGLESTIVSFTGTSPLLLRPGGVPLEDIEAVVGTVVIGADAERPQAPGQLPRHYAPRTPVEIVVAPGAVSNADRAGAALLLVIPSSAEIQGFAHVERLSDGDLTTAAANLFAALRSLDRGGFSRIYCVGVEPTGLGRAIMDRLCRAAHPA